MSKVTITLDDLRGLVAIAKRQGTESAGLDLAVEFAPAAVDRVAELESLVLAAYTEGRMRQDLHLRDPDESWRTSKAYAALRGEEE